MNLGAAPGYGALCLTCNSPGESAIDRRYLLCIDTVFTHFPCELQHETSRVIQMGAMTMRTIAVAALGTSILTALVFAPPATAADLSRPITKAPPAAPAYVPYNWSGFYIGANIGAAWGGADLDSSNGFRGSTHTDAAFIGGGQVGYNFQFNPSIVIGAEADFQGSSISGNGPGTYYGYPSPYFAPGTGALNDILVPVAAINGGNLGLNWIGTVRGRAGWLFTPSLLVYGTAGFDAEFD